jgi:GT2 family glycosyltransferase
VDGPFDADYEDSQTDLYFGWKLRLSGRSVRVCPGAKAFRETSDSQGWKEVYHSHRNRWMSLLTFYEASTLIRVLPLIFLDMMVALLKSLATGLAHFIGVSAAVAWMFLHPFTIIGKRSPVRSKRKVRDATIVRNLSGRIASDTVFGSRFLNLLSLSYCGFVGLEVLELQDE